MSLASHRLSLALVLSCSALGLVGCTVRTAGPAAPPPVYGPPPGSPPPAYDPGPQPPQPPPPPPVAQPAAQPPPMADPCPQELGADAPDTPDGAPALGVGTHRGCYGIEDPKDTFSITAPPHPGPVLYRLRVSGAGAQACLVGKDADRANMPGLNGCGKNKDAQLDMWALVMGGTTWTLETRDLSGDSRNRAKPYTLDIQATPLADPGEPDSRERPVPLALGEAKQAFLVNAANVKELDNDYFAVVVPNDMRKKGRFQVVISDVPTEVIVALQVFDADGRKLGAANGGNAGATLRKEVKMKGPGTYVFHVRNLSGEGKNIGGKDEPKSRALKPYTITVTAD